ncbi:MAG TPA: hypothetical protein DEZ08_05315 [Dehalococcoidia bacterium]|nr:hypothetical protein [Dehalococcoidia bacterium]
MTTEYGAIAAIILGLILGLKHATDADHVVAVTTIVSEFKNPLRSLWVGASWGLGHTTPLLILGIIILIFKETVIDRYTTVAPFLEFAVAIMLVFLGLQVFWNLRKGRLLHTHQHEHDDGPHLHIHGTHPPEESPDVEKTHGRFSIGKPFFRMKSFTIGIIHGLAGSAAVMLVLLPTIDSFVAGIAYIVLFGVGTIASMAIITIIISIPFAMSGNNQKMNNIVNGVAGTASILFGLALGSDLALGTTIIPF